MRAAPTLTPLCELLGQRGVNPAHEQDESQVHDAAGDVGDGPGLRSHAPVVEPA